MGRAKGFVNAPRFSFFIFPSEGENTGVVVSINAIIGMVSSFRLK